MCIVNTTRKITLVVECFISASCGKVEVVSKWVFPEITVVLCPSGESLICRCKMSKKEFVSPRKQSQFVLCLQHRVGKYFLLMFSHFVVRHEPTNIPHYFGLLLRFPYTSRLLYPHKGQCCFNVAIKWEAEIMQNFLKYIVLSQLDICILPCVMVICDWRR